MGIHFNQRYFILEGNIGSGKSTFLRLLGQYLNTKIVYEPHEKWQNVNGENLLDYFYKDTKRWAYTFQTYAFITRILELKENLLKNDQQLLVMERSIYSDRYCFAKNCFELGVMNSLEWKLYQEWFEWLEQGDVPKPSGFIYQQTDPEVCYTRLLKRNRSEESEVALDYLKLLHEKHESWLMRKEGIASYLADVPVLVIPVNDEFERDIVVQEKHMQQIVRFLEHNYAIPSTMSIKEKQQ